MPPSASSPDMRAVALLDGRMTVQSALQGCTAEEVQHLVDHLKQEANRHWSIDPNQSLKLADMIIQIGKACGNQRQIALGTMARGDALKVLGRMQEAGENLEQAGALFLAAGDDLGWARTRIGYVAVSVDTQETERALADAQRAQAIFLQRDEHEYQINLEMNLGVVHHWSRNYPEALRFHQAGLIRAQQLGVSGEKYLGRFYLNLGYAHRLLGNFRVAQQHCEQALAWFIRRGEAYWIPFAEMNLAAIAQYAGQYKHALRLLYSALEHTDAQTDYQRTQLRHEMVQCYIELDRFEEARRLVLDVIAQYKADGADLASTEAYLCLSTVEAESGNLQAASHALDSAEALFGPSVSAFWPAQIKVWRATIALRQGLMNEALQLARDASVTFELEGHTQDNLNALLLQGQALLMLNRTDEALEVTRSALRVAKHHNLTSKRYSAHHLLGQLHKKRGALPRARRHFSAAVAAIERLQRGLTITLRPGFLQRRLDALHELIGLHLHWDETACAFETLERAKSSVFFAYLTAQENVQWLSQDSQSKPLLDELQRLREEHQWLYYALSGLAKEEEITLNSKLARRNMMAIEKRIRGITEQLYVYTQDGQEDRLRLPCLADIQECLEDHACLLEYYNDGTHLWVFLLDRDGLAVFPLDVTSQNLDRWLGKLQFNIACALKAGPNSTVEAALTWQFNQISQQLYRALIAPVAVRLQRRQQLLIVPFGSLHYLPFDLLYTGTHYLFEQWEMVSLPTAGLITHPTPRREGQALVLAHAFNDTLPQTLAEADMVHGLFGGIVKRNDQANRDALHSPPCQILHVAAHGEFRIDQPDLSFIQLADGQLFTDDLLQHDLSYELVTLSACETGRAHVAAGDELIGLGRGCLYAGAGALLVSQWPVEDRFALTLMESFYRELKSGASKAAALQHAQQTLLAQAPTLHPASWGAFQLIGNAAPLSHL